MLHISLKMVNGKNTDKHCDTIGELLEHCKNITR